MSFPMAQPHVSSSPYFSLLTNATASKSVRPSAPLQFHSSSSSRKSLVLTSSFKNGSHLFFSAAFRKRKTKKHAMLVSIRCEQGAKQSNGLDVWLGRLAMVGFATAITVEVATGKGLLENFGLPTPIPTLALIVTALVGVLTAIFIFQSASRD